MLRTSSIAAVLLAAGVAFGVAGPASAQEDECAAGAKLLKSRQALMAAFQGGGKKRQMTAGDACSRLNALSANGNQVLAWINKSGSWCNVPPSLAEAIKGQQGQIGSVRARACGMASKQKQMEFQARKQAQQQQNPFGPDDVTGGPRRLPTGAL
jgi:hypothetical protein